MAHDPAPERVGPFKLRALSELARDAGAATITEEARALAERAAEGRFFVACVGQFKRGKSTLLNALIGADMLPTGTVPVTSVVTVLRHGEALTARLRMQGGEWRDVDPADLSDYVSEAANPGNTKGVVAVEVFAPSPLLASGLCFVDTPGLGSVFAASTDATREFVPHIDAALVVFGADPPISGEEIHLIEEIAQQVETFVFVLNKADRVQPGELEESAAFAQRILSEHLNRPIDRVFRVSALETVQTGGATRDWTALTSHLSALARDSGRALVEGAVERGFQRLSTRLRNILNEERAALQRPLEESEQRVRVLRRAGEEAARALWEISPLFDAEVRRLGLLYEQRRDAFIKRTMPLLAQSVRNWLTASKVRFGPALRAAAFEHAQTLARDAVLPWLRSNEHDAAAQHAASTARFTSIVNDLLDRLQGSETWDAVPLPDRVGEATELQGKTRFQFASLTQIESPAGLVPLLEWCADAVLPRPLVMKRVERAAIGYLSRLVEANAHRVENSIKQRLQDSRLRLESEIRYTLKEVLEAAERGMEHARETQAKGREAVAAETARIDALVARLTACGAP